METVQNLSISSIDSFKHGWRAIGCCNGLVCVIVNLNRERSSHKLCLWNPVIREVKEIPQTTRNDMLVSYEFGFGFSSVVNDYKIVKFYKNKNTMNAKKNKKKADGGHDRVDVYSLNTNSWKKLQFRAVLKNTSIISKQVSVDGTIFWLGAQQDSSHVVVSFDIGTPVFTLTPISFPFKRRDFPAMTRLGFYQNKFYIFHHYHDDFCRCINIRVMAEVAGEYGKSFSCIDRYDIRTMKFFFGLVCIWRDEFVFYELRKLKSFNITTKEWKDFPKSADYDWFVGVNYEESLVSVWNT